jgi:hypothetical protein
LVTADAALIQLNDAKVVLVAVTVETKSLPLVGVTVDIAWSLAATTGDDRGVSAAKGSVTNLCSACVFDVLSSLRVFWATFTLR